MNIIHVTSESNPFIKTGGLGDVVYSLAKETCKLEQNVAIFIPYYLDISLGNKYDMQEVLSFTQQLDWRKAETIVYKSVVDGIDYYFIANDRYFSRKIVYGDQDDNERFAYFTRAVVTAIEKLNLNPDIIHLHEWQVGMLPCLIKEQHNDYYLHTKFIFTIHNPLFKGKLSVDEYESYYELSKELYYNGTLRYGDGVSTLKAGIVYSDLVSTVSPSYRNELLSPYSNMGLAEILADKGDKFIGILNGCDYDEFNPHMDNLIPDRYDTNTFYNAKLLNKSKLFNKLGLVDNGKPLFTIVSRLTWQKGIDHLVVAIETLAKWENHVIILGSGDMDAQGKIERLKKQYPKYVTTFFMFNNELAHNLYAASDFYLMPSIFEPCGISQMIALRYGSLPIVRLTGGLIDTVIPYNGKNIETANGFAFSGNDSNDFLEAIKEAYKTYYNLPKRRKLLENAMKCNFSWKENAKQYLDIYTQLINNN